MSRDRPGPRGLLALTGPAAHGEEAREAGRAWAVRDEIAPRSWTESDAEGRLLLGLAGTGGRRGGRTLGAGDPGDRGRNYAFRAEYRTHGVETPDAQRARARRLDRRLGTSRGGRWSTRCRGLAGQRTAGRRSRGRLPRAGGGHTPRASSSTSAGPPTGEVLWRDVALREAEPPEPRRVRLAAVNHRPQETSVARRRTGRSSAGSSSRPPAATADIVVLPEGITVVGNGLTYEQAAEPVPGPTTAFLGAAGAASPDVDRGRAVRARGDRVYNTAVLVGRDGSPGRTLPQDEPPRRGDRGRHHPGRRHPGLRHRLRTGRADDLLGLQLPRGGPGPRDPRGRGPPSSRSGAGRRRWFSARAIENQVYVVASGYDFRTGIFDRRGQRIADAREDPEVVVAEVDLNERTLWPWLRDWRARIWREAPAWADEP